MAKYELTLEQKIKKSVTAKRRYEANREKIAAQTKHWQQTHKEKVAEYKKRYYQANKKKTLAQTNAWRDTNREKLAGRPRPNVCEVCSAAPDTRALHWDHDHVTGAFRGWICHGCNVALGYVKDNPETLRKLADYLEKT